MYDIIMRSAEAQPSDFGFSKFYFYEDVKSAIAKVSGIGRAGEYGNRRVLVLLDEYNEDIGPMRQFAEKGRAAFLIDLGRIVGTFGFRRAVELAKLRRFAAICLKYSVPFAVATFAKDRFSIRTRDEVAHICALIGLNRGQAEFAMERIGLFL